MGNPYLLTLLWAIVNFRVYDALKGKRCGVDGFGLIHRAIGSTLFQYVVQGKKDLVVKIVMNVVKALCYLGKEVVIVFDGNETPGKSETRQERVGELEEQEKLLQQLLDQGQPSQKINTVASKVGASIPKDLFDDIVKEIKKYALEVTGCKLQILVAPYEADHQLVLLNNEKIIDVVVATDSDLVAHGCDVVVTHFKCTRGRKGKYLYQGNVYKKSDIIAKAQQLSTLTASEKTAQLKADFHSRSLKKAFDDDKAQQIGDLFALVQSRGIKALGEFLILSKNDYANVKNCGPKYVSTLLGSYYYYY
jgi:5'-3' exonuclease